MKTFKISTRTMRQTMARLVAIAAFGAISLTSVSAQAADTTKAFLKSDAAQSSSQNQARLVPVDFSIGFTVGNGFGHFNNGNGHAGGRFRDNDHRYYNSKKFYDSKKYYSSKKYYAPSKGRFNGHKFHGGNSFKFSNNHRGHGKFSSRNRHRRH